MKKTGIIIFAVALVMGLVVSDIFSFGRMSSGLFHFNVDFGTAKGSGKTATEHRNISGFKGVEVGGIFQVEITAGRDFSVDIESDDNLLPLIKTEVKHGVLEIETEKRFSTENPLKVRISAPDIDSLDVSGAAHLTLDGVKNTGLAVESSGASQVKISGETSKFTVEMSGASRIDAGELRAANANIESSGASQAEVNVSEALTVDASGASHVTYSGTPTLNKKTSGVSGVSQAKSEI